MLEFAKVPGLTKIFNRDDWKKVFLACGELPDYRESKYSSYFITKDASVRAGKLYYEKNALEKGGYSYDPISHIKLENEKDVTTPEDRSYCFGAGEKYEYNGFILEAKYVPNQRNVTPDILLDPTKTYSIKRNNEYKRLTGYTQWTQAKIGTTTYYFCNLGWLGSYGAYTAAVNIAGSKVSGLDLYQGKKEIDGEGREVWTFTTIDKSKWKGDDTYAPPKFDDESSNIWIKETVSAFETARNSGLVFKAFDPVASLNTLVYDSDIIGHKIINSKYNYYYRAVTGIDPTKDWTFRSGVIYFGYDGTALHELSEGDDYNVGDKVGYSPTTDTTVVEKQTYYIRNDSNKTMTAVTSPSGNPQANGWYIKDTDWVSIADPTSTRSYEFLPIKLSSTAVEWTQALLEQYGRHVYRIASDLNFYTINDARGTISRVNYLGTGEKISDAQMGKPTDLKFKKGHAYYKRSKATLYTETGYELMNPVEDHFSFGGSIAEYTAKTGTEVFMHVTPFWIVNNDIIGANTHGKPWYERAGTDYPYEGFVAVTTKKTDTNARGQLVTCKRRTYMVTEDLIHGYTGDGATAVSKPYFEYHKDTNQYVKVPTDSRPVFRLTEGSSFIQTTEDILFDAEKKYFKDIMGQVRVVVGTQAQVDAGEADVVAGSRVDMCSFPVYDRHRRFYYRGKDLLTGEGNWDFTQVSKPYGITTDKHWKTQDGALLQGHYLFYIPGSDYSFANIAEPFSVVDDAIFGYKDLNDVFYGYEALTADKDYEDGITTVAQYLATRAGDNVGNVAREDLTTHEITVITAGSTVMSTKDEEGQIRYAYHVRNYDHVAQNKTGGVYPSIYCVFDDSVGVINDDNVGVTDEQLGKHIGFSVYSKLAEVPQYYYMKDPAAVAWRNKFAPFSLPMSPALTSDTSPVEGQTYYTAQNVYEVSNDTSWGPQRDTETTPVKHWESTYKYYFKENDTFVEVPEAYKQAVASPLMSRIKNNRPVYVIMGRDYIETEVSPSDNPAELGLYIYLDSYYGRRINSQSKIIYTNTLDGSVPTECLVFVEYNPDEADEGTSKEEGEEFADGEEIPTEPALYVESRNGEAILPDEYYEECYGLFYWDQFFLKRNFSASTCTGVYGYVCKAVSTGNAVVGTVRLNWSDPGIMLKKDEPTANPDAWNRTSVVLHYDDKEIVIFENMSKDAFSEPGNPLIIDTSMPDFLSRFQAAYETVKTSEDFCNALLDGYLSFVAVGASGTTSECSYRLRELRLDNSASYGFVDIRTGEVLATYKDGDEDTGYSCSANFETVDGITSRVLPGLKYLTPNEKGVFQPDPYVYPYCTPTNTVEFRDAHKFVFDKDVPLFLVEVRKNKVAEYMNEVVSINPVVVGYGSVLEGDDVPRINDVDYADGSTLTSRYCVYVQLAPSTTLNELVRAGRAEDLLPVGSEMDLNEIVKDEGKTETIGSATVVDIDHVVLKRRVAMKQQLIDESGITADDGVTYYAPYATDDMENYNPPSGNHWKFTPVKLPAGVLVENRFYLPSADNVPQHQFYTRTWNETTKSTSYQPINYDSDPNWMEKVLVTGSQIFYRSRVLANTFIEFKDDEHSLTLRMNATGSSIANSFRAAFDDHGDESSGRWINSSLREFLNTDHEGYSASFVDFANCIREVVNTTFDVEYEFYKSGSNWYARIKDQYFESEDGAFKEGKKYYILVDSAYVLYTNYNVDDPFPAGVTIYEQRPRYRITFDKFWMPSVSQVGLQSTPVDSDSDIKSVPATPEGSMLDIYDPNPQLRAKSTLPVAIYYGSNPRIIPKTGGWQYWTRTRINAANDRRVTTIDAFGYPVNVDCAEVKNVFPFFTFG